NIFPGDMLLKNFGVTNRGRVVFYDYDEIGLITDLHFRKFPESDDPYDDMSSTPAFGVGPNDVFPEELARFLGLEPSLRKAFMERHSDLFETDFWVGIQRRLESGETIDIRPYKRSRALDVR
ncbi:MAG: bifunctional isocitrate dehydrogenase kinase/phosphatase, partial [Acidimicrobiia bacterium]|nr:bifunctional isocitrate dehydrogenase kinase/phosphatase [Acidimicrobiia bacterium]